MEKRTPNTLQYVYTTMQNVFFNALYIFGISLYIKQEIWEAFGYYLCSL